MTLSLYRMFWGENRFQCMDWGRSGPVSMDKVAGKTR